MQDTAATPSPAWHQWLLGLAILATLALYVPAIHGPWLHDDFPNIVLNPTIQATSINAESLAHGTTHYAKRPLAMMSFTANHAMCGLSPGCFKSVNVALHLLTGLALFWLLSTLRAACLARRAVAFPVWVPAVAVALWLLHPLQVSTVLYAVQRMTQIATVCAFAALALYLHGRFLAASLGARLLSFAGAGVAVGIGLAGKESTVLVVPYALALELLLLDDRHRAWLRRPAVTTAIVIGTLLAAAIALRLGWRWIEAGYLTRDFTPAERLLTEARIVLHYLWNILWPDYRDMPFFLDGMRVSRSITEPWTTLPAVIFILSLAAAALLTLWRRPSLVAFGILFFFGGHLLESTIIGLIPGYEHRNYGPSAGILLALVAAVAARLDERGAKITATAMVLLLTAALLPRVSAWSSEAAFVAYLDAYAADSSSAHNYIGRHHLSLQDAQGGPDYDAPDERLGRAHMTRAAEMSSQPFLSAMQLLLRPASPAEREHQWVIMMRAAREAPPSADMMTATQAMISCFVFTACQISADRFELWLDTAMSNPRLRGAMAREMQRVAGSFYVRTGRDVPRGLELSRLAAGKGSPEALESLIKNLAYAGHPAEAMSLYEDWQRRSTVPEDRRARIERAFAESGSKP